MPSECLFLLMSRGVGYNSHCYFDNCSFLFDIEDVWYSVNSLSRLCEEVKIFNLEEFKGKDLKCALCQVHPTAGIFFFFCTCMFARISAACTCVLSAVYSFIYTMFAYGPVCLWNNGVLCLALA